MAKKFQAEKHTKTPWNELNKDDNESMQLFSDLMPTVWKCRKQAENYLFDQYFLKCPAINRSVLHPITAPRIEPQ